MVFNSYPSFLLFIPPVWLWMLWHFSALAYEMDIMLKSVSENNEEHIQLVRKAWKLFTSLTFACVISCIIHGLLAYYWWQSNYDQTVFWLLLLPGTVFILFSRLVEPYFCEWQAQVSVKK